jgi:hypothetical protein
MELDLSGTKRIGTWWTGQSASRSERSSRFVTVKDYQATGAEPGGLFCGSSCVHSDWGLSHVSRGYRSGHSPGLATFSCRKDIPTSRPSREASASWLSARPNLSSKRQSRCKQKGDYIARNIRPISACLLPPSQKSKPTPLHPPLPLCPQD